MLVDLSLQVTTEKVVAQALSNKH